jgi:gliding motility-associated protein GldL
MARLYGLGASVVILGALFKINHYPGANTMLVIGLGTEALIFFFSAWEAPYVEPDWSLVYPELAGLYHGDGYDESGKPKRKPTEELDKMLKDASIDAKLIERLGDGLKKLSDNTSKLSDITDAASATSEYVSNVKTAARSVDNLSKSYNMQAESLQKDANASEAYLDSIKNATQNAAGLSNTFKEAAESIKGDVSVTKDFSNSMRTAIQSANSLADEYTRSAEMLSKSAQNLDFSAVDGKAYNAQMQKIAENLAALNSVYQLQLQSSNEQIQSANKMRETMGDFLKTVKDSADMMNNYKEQMNLLTERVEVLNSVYGGMLTAMTVRPK